MSFEMPKINQHDKKRPNPTWERVKDAGKIATLTFLLTFIGTELATAQEKDDGSKKESRTELISKSRELIKNITFKLKEKGKGARMGSAGQVPTRKWKTPDGKSAVTAGYDEKEENSKWLIHEEDGSSRLWLDKGADGSIDRLVMNGSADPKLSANAKSAFNVEKAFEDINKLAEEAKEISGVMPEDVKVFDITYGQDGKPELSSVDFKTGESAKLTGGKAEALTTKVQGIFSGNMGNVEKGLSEQ